jgi:outer membrane protein assembly factor BamA
LEAILATGFFDKTATRVYTEEGVRSGVGVIFEMVELPLISAVKFEGLKIDQSVVLKALEKEQINLRTGTPFKVEQMKDALRIVKQVLESNGQGFSKVDLQIEHVTAMTINVIFVITNE